MAGSRTAEDTQQGVPVSQSRALGVDARCPRVNGARKSSRVADSTRAAADEKQSQVNGGKEQD